MLIGQNLKNKLINGGFDYWQRNTTFANPTSFTADRWAIQFDGTIGTFSVSRQDFALGQTDVPGSPRYFLRWDHTVAGSGSTNRSLVQRIESVRTLEGKKATLAFYAKADAARTLGVRATQSFGSGGSPSANVPIAEQFVDLTPSWQRFVVTFDVPSISGKTLGTNGDDFLQFDFRMPVNTVMTIDLAQAMFVEGESAGDFELAGGDLPGELKLCQRYYQSTDRQAGQEIWLGSGVQQSLTATAIFCPLITEMRATPVLVTSSPGSYEVISGISTLGAISALAIQGVGKKILRVNVTHASSGTAGYGAALRIPSSAAAGVQFAFDAEF